MSEFKMNVSIDMRAVERNIKDKLKNYEDIIQSDASQYAIVSQYAKEVEYLVPKKTGALRDSAEIVRGGKHAKFSVKYDPVGQTSTNAVPRHYGQAAYHIHIDPEARTTPGTFDHWNQHFTRADRQGFYAWITNFLVKVINHGQK